MIAPKLSEYIKNQHLLGTSNETIKSILIKAGWQSSQIDQALKELTISEQTDIQIYNKNPIFEHSFIKISAILIIIILVLVGVFFYRQKTADLHNLEDMIQKFSLAKDFELNGEAVIQIKSFDTFQKITFARLRQDFTTKEAFNYGVIRAKFRSRTDTDTKSDPDDPSPFNNRNERLAVDVEIETRLKNNPNVFLKQTYSFDITNIDQATFFRLTQYTGVENTSFEAVRNQWQKINPKTIRLALQIPTKKDISGVESPEEGISLETSQKIRQTVAKNLFFNNIKKGQVEDLYENIQLQKYYLNLDSKKAEKLIKELSTILSGNDLAISVLSTANNYLPEFSGTSFEIFTDTLTNLPYRVVITLNSGSSPNQSKIENALIQLQFRNYRHTFNEKPPAEYIETP